MSKQREPGGIEAGARRAHSARAAPAGSRGLLAADLDNDGLLDLLAYGGKQVELWQGQPGGAFTVATEAFGLAAAEAVVSIATALPAEDRYVAIAGLEVVEELRGEDTVLMQRVRGARHR